MSDTAARLENWRAKLASDCVDGQIDALRQISATEQVAGLAVEVIRLAASDENEVRMWSAEALESSVHPQVAEISGLITMLETTADREIGYWAATMLGRLGTDAAAGTGALEACLRESTYLPARERAAWALSQIGPGAASAIAALRQAADTAPPRLQRLANQAIERILGSDNVTDQTGTEGDIAA